MSKGPGKGWWGPPKGDHTKKKLTNKGKEIREKVRNNNHTIIYPKGYYEYHGTPQPIVGKTLEIGSGYGGGDSGGIFTTPSMRLAKEFAVGKYGKIYKVDLSNKRILNLSVEAGIKKVKSMIGQSFVDIDNEKVVFTQQDFDFLFPVIGGKHHGADWATFTSYTPLFEKFNYDGVRIWENTSKDKRIVSTALFKGGLKIQKNGEI